MYHRYLASPLASQFEGGHGNTPTGLPSNLTHRQRHVIAWLKLPATHCHIPISIKAFGVFSHDNQIELPRHAVNALTYFARTNVGIQI